MSNISDKEQHMDVLLNGFFERSGEAFAQLEAPANFEAAVRSAALRAQMPAFAAPEEPAAQPTKPFWRKKRFIGAIVAVACLAVALTALWPFGNEDFSDFSGIISIRPALAYSDGIDPAEGFIITSDQPINTQVVEEYLQVEPAFNYTVKEQKNGTEYLVKPAEPLEGNTVYKLALDPANSNQAKPVAATNSWAFQTVSEFASDGTLPRDTSTMVDINSAIELYFTQELAENAASLVSIEPALAGNWLVEGSRLRFVPETAMDYNTVYTVTAKAGIQSYDAKGQTEEDIVVRFQTQTKEEADSSYSFDIESSFAGAFSTKQIPWFYFWSSKQEMTEEDLVEVTLYRYADENAYAEAKAKSMGEYNWCRSSDANISTEGLQQVTSFSTAIIQEGGYGGGSGYLYFPENPGAGWYLMEARFGDVVRRQFVQVTDLSAYLGESMDEGILWVHDLQSGQPVSGASVLLNGEQVAKTDADGVATLKHGLLEKAAIYQIKTEDRALVLAAYDSWRREYYDGETLREAYWHYLYCDRKLYKPGDTVNLFGVLQSRDADYEEIKEVELQLKGYGLGDGYGGLATNMFKQTVTIKNGVFDTAFQLPVLEPGWYEIYMIVGDTFIDACSFEVKEYTKPAYQISLSPSVRGLMAGETVTWTIGTSFFDGTPFPNSSIRLYGRGIADIVSIKTDAKGQATYQVTIPLDYAGSLTSGAYLDATSAVSENGSITAYDSVSVFNSDLEVRTEAEREGNQAKLRLTPYKVDISGIENWYNYDEADYLKDFSGTGSVEVIFYEQIWHKYEDGQVYDPYTKTYTPFYYYELEEKETHRETVSFSGARTKDLTVDLNSENAFRIRIEGKDGAGRSFYRTAYVGPASTAVTPYYSYYNKSLTLQTEDQEGYEPGQTVNSYLAWGQDPLAAGEGQNLFFRTKEDILDYKATTENAYSYTFEEDFIPNVNLYAVHFDGETYYNTSRTYMLSTSARALQLTMKTDKERYAPGEKAVLTFRLTDSKGQPVEGSINVNLVDEALLAIRDQQVDILERLFSNTYSKFFQTYISHLPDEKNAGAEGGGEGGGERSDFRDTALFKTLQTDKNGMAQVEVELPDNITSWRVIYQAYAGDAYSASGVESIPAGLPFFVDTRLADYYLAGDAPIIAVRSAGDAVGATDTVRYTVEIPGLGLKQTVEGPASEWTDIELPTLSVGEYEVKISGSFGENSDSVSLSFAVYNTKTSHYVQESEALKTTTRLAGSKEKITTVFFSNEKKTLALRGLLDLAYQSDIRLEQRLSSYLAQTMLAERFPDSFAMPTDEDREALINTILQYQVDHGLAVLPYGEADLEASVLAASFAGDLVPTNSLNGYFHGIYNNSESDKEKSLALWGQAALGRPVLYEIEKMLQSETLDGESRLNLICALYFAGNGAGAAELALDFVNQWTEPVDALYRAAIDSEDRQQVLDATAKLALLANIFDLPQADGLYEYLLSNRSDEDYYLLEQVGILQARLDRGLPDSEFTYKLEGEKVEVDLAKQGVYALSLSPAQLANLSFLKVEGNVTATTFYEVEGLPSATGQSSTLKLTRTYPSAEEMQNSLDENGRFRVRVDFTIAKDAPDGYYTVHDFLPAGLTYIETQQNSETPSNCWQVLAADKEIAFSAYKSGDKAVSGWFAYYVRATGGGSYKAESAYISHSLLDGVYAKSNEQQIALK